MPGIGRKRSEMGGSPAGASYIRRQVNSLFSGFNKSKKSEEDYDDGPSTELKPLLSLDISDEDLRKLSDQWQKDYDSYEKEIKTKQEDNYKYWRGEQYASKAGDNRGQDNVIFEASETLLPIISRQNPEPLITTENTEEALMVADQTAKILTGKADETRLKSKVKIACRHWLLYYLGCFKMGWDSDVNDFYFQVINPQRLILDPKGTFDGAEFKGEYVGEAKSTTAEELAKEFPIHAAEIEESVKGKMGTSVNYHEWWTDEYVFWRYGETILDKRQNPYWNGSTQTEQVDEFGTKTQVEQAGINHFATPKKPYSFLTVFNTGKQPHDETSLVEQCKPLQDIVNKRLKQIDKNADDTNNGWVFNNQFSTDDAKTALNAMRNGGAIISATERISESVMRFPAPALATFVYQDLLDKREQIYNIMGVRGSTASGVMSERTVRGKIEIKGQDIDRLALVIEQVEQLVDHLYNLAVQTIYVFGTPESAARFLGIEKATQYINTLKSLPSRSLIVSIKEGSTIPQDPLMKRNEAVDLWNAGAIDPKTLYERMQFPDPEETLKRFIDFKTNPQALLPQNQLPVLPTGEQVVAPPVLTGIAQ